MMRWNLGMDLLGLYCRRGGVVRERAVTAGQSDGLGVTGSRWWMTSLAAVVTTSYPHTLRAVRLASMLSSF